EPWRISLLHVDFFETHWDRLADGLRGLSGCALWHSIASLSRQRADRKARRRVASSQTNLLDVRINHGLRGVHRTRLANMDGNVVGINLLPAVHVIEQFGRSTLRTHQGCF